MGGLKAWFARLQQPLSDAMLMALVLWLCSLVLVGLLVLPFFGLKVSAVVALVLLIGLLVICWMVCSRTAIHFPGGKRL